MHSGPIVIVEDDEDDQFLLQRIFQELEVANPVHYFSDGQQVLDYLTTTDEIPFLILCDVNMPIMSGIELRKRIAQHETLSQKAIPFIYLSTDASLPIVEDVTRIQFRDSSRRPLVIKQLKNNSTGFLATGNTAFSRTNNLSVSSFCRVK